MQQYLNVDIDCQINALISQVAPERLHGLLAGLDVHEHALKLAGELVPALCLEFREHGMLCVIVCNPPHQQPLAEMLLVVPLEQILVLQIPAQANSGVAGYISIWCEPASEWRVTPELCGNKTCNRLSYLSAK